VLPPIVEPAPTPPGPVVHELKAKDFSLGSPDFGQPELFEYPLPELFRLGFEAIAHFKIDPRTGIWPKHEEVVAYLVTCRLSGGRLVSKRLATMLATAIKGAESMKGGNSKRR
jgi:hypothetical protein